MIWYRRKYNADLTIGHKSDKNRNIAASAGKGSGGRSSYFCFCNPPPGGAGSGDISAAANFPPEFEQILIKRSTRRKTIAIKLKNDFSVELFAPMHLPEERLRKAYGEFTPWLQKKFQQLARQPELAHPLRFEFKVGNNFYFCGQSYPLAAAENSNSSVIVLEKDKLLTPTGEPGEIKKLLEAFYRRHARRLISSRLEFFSNKFGFAMPAININGARGRFGSCNSKKELNFSWHLAMYPMELIDLVILHECAHFREMNHSKAFYAVLSEYLPDHRQRNRELDLWSKKLANYPK